MTPAERTLLLAVAVVVHDHTRPAMADYLRPLIAAVEAEAKPDPLQSQLDTFGKILHAAAHDPEPLTEGKSCETCANGPDRHSCTIGALGRSLCGRHGVWNRWQPKPTKADVCPTCSGSGTVLMHQRNVSSVGEGYRVCPDCGGTGRKEKK